MPRTPKNALTKSGFKTVVVPLTPKQFDALSAWADEDFRSPVQQARWLLVSQINDKIAEMTNDAATPAGVSTWPPFQPSANGGAQQED